MATEALQIRVTEDGSREVQRRLEGVGRAGQQTADGVKRSMDGIDRSSRQAASAVDLLRRALLAVGVAALAREMFQLINASAQLQNRLRTVTDGQIALRNATRDVFQVANDTRSPIESVTELFTRLTNTTKELGLSQREVLGITKGLGQAIQLSGASAVEADQSLRQLGQGLGSGRLQGDELRSVLEGMPIVADALAKSLGITRGELKKFGEEGKLTTQVVLNAIRQALPQWEEQFRKLPQTPAQAFIVLRNRVLEAVTNFDQATGASQRLAGVINQLSNFVVRLGTDGLPLAVTAFFRLVSLAERFAASMSRLDQASGISRGFGQALDFAANNADRLAIALGTTLAITAIPRLISALAALRLAIVSNPLGLLATAVAVLVGYLVGFNDTITVTKDGLVTLGDLGAAAWDVIGQRIDAIVNDIRVYVPELDAVYQLWTRIRDAVSEIDFSPEGLARMAASAADFVLNLQRGLMLAGMAFGDYFKKAAFNALLELKKWIEDLINSAINSINEKLTSIRAENPLLAQVLPSSIGKADFSFGKASPYTLKDPQTQEVRPVGFSDATTAFGSILESNLSGRAAQYPFGDFVNDTFSKARDIAEQRRILQEFNRVSQEARQLASNAEAYFAQASSFAKAQSDLQNVLNSGTEEQKRKAADFLSQGSEQLRQAGQLLRSQTTQLLSDAGAVAVAQLARVQGQVAGIAELSSLTTQIIQAVGTALEEAKNKLSSAASSVGMSAAQGFLAGFRAGIGGALSSIAAAASPAAASAANGIPGYLGAPGLSNGILGGGSPAPAPTPEMSQYLSKLQDIQSSMQSLNSQTTQFGTDATSAFADAGRAAQGFGGMTQNIGNQFNNFGSMFQNVFSGLENALVGFVTTGKLDFKQLINSILADLARMVVQMLIIRPLMGFFGGMFGGFFGFSGGGLAGGLMPGFAAGGAVRGPGTSTSDSILARLSHGEFVVNAAATSQYLPLLRAINDGGALMPAGWRLPQYATGGIVGGFDAYDRTMLPMDAKSGAGYSDQSARMTQMIARQVDAVATRNRQTAGGSSSPIVMNSTVNVTVSSRGDANEDGQAIAKQVDAQIKSRFVELVQNEQRPGGLLSKSGR